MGYQKIIQTGKYIEIYEYENEYRRPRKRRRKNRSKGDYVLVKKRRFDNVYRQGRSFKRLVRANFEGQEAPLLVTLTYRDIIGVEQGYKDFNKFIKRLRYLFGKDFRYIAVPEFQKRGAIHFHVLVWGLPSYIHRSERQTRLVADLWGFGFVDIKLTDGSLKLVGYLAKYLVKVLGDERLSGKKGYVSSRNVRRPQVFKNSVLYTYTKELFDIDLSTTETLQDKYFSTVWLGQGRYRLYKLK